MDLIKFNKFRRENLQVWCDQLEGVCDGTSTEIDNIERILPIIT